MKNNSKRNAQTWSSGLLALIVIPALLGVNGCSTEGQTGAGFSDNQELMQLFEEDQADRSPGADGIDWAVVSRRDSVRRVRVYELLDSDMVRTSEDFRHAAMVFQHGMDTTAARMASDLARKAVDLDSTNANAKWLMAAAWDRYQMRLGKPQWYGTQFVRDNGQTPWRLYDIDTTMVSDDERRQLGVRTLSEARARVEEMNARAIR